MSRPVLSRLVLLVSLGLLWAIVIQFGLHLREQAWSRTGEPERRLRFEGDIRNAMSVGRGTVLYAARLADVPPERLTLRTFLDGYLERYAQQKRRHDEGRPEIDYPPGRLLVMSLWMWNNIQRDGPRVEYRDEIVRPLLNLNLLVESLTTIGVVLLVGHHLHQGGTSVSSVHGLAQTVSLARRGIIASLAGMLVWLNPALILNAHAWPQWDAWVLPFVVWGVFFARLDRWGSAGFIVAIGGFFKGQVYIVAPLLLLWPLLQFRFDRLYRAAVGFILGFTLGGSPWLAGGSSAWSSMIPTPADSPAWWIALVALLWAVVWCGWPRRGLVSRSRIVSRVVQIWPYVMLAVPVLGVLLVARSSDEIKWGLLALILLTCLLRSNDVGVRLATLALVFAGTFVWIGHLSGATRDWLEVGFPTDRYMGLWMGPTNNMPSILGGVYGLAIDDIFWGVNLRSLLQAIAYAGIALCGLAMARATLRRKSSLPGLRPGRVDRSEVGFLCAIGSAWVWMFTWMPQMHERYLLWGAVLSAMWISRGFWGLLAHGGVTLLSTVMHVHCMMQANGGASGRTLVISPELLDHDLYQVLNGLHPHAGWAVLVLAFVGLGFSLSRGQSNAPWIGSGRRDVREPFCLRESSAIHRVRGSS